MTNYENLMNKAQKLLDCAMRTTGEMRNIWLNKYSQMLGVINNLTIEEAAAK